MSSKKVFGLVKSTLDGSEYNAKDYLSRFQSEIPKVYSYRDYCGKVENQGSLPYCVPYTIANNTNWNNSMSDIKRDLSLSFLFDSRPDKSMEGMECKQALDFIQKIGWTESKYYKNGKLKEGAPFYKIRMYARICDGDTLKKSLLINGPCLFALPVYSSESVEFWNGSGKVEGYHAVSCIGWDESGFIIKNSWGHEYGDSGYSVIKYEDFYRIIECWTIFN